MMFNSKELLEQGIDAIVQMRMQANKKPMDEPKELLDAEFDMNAFSEGLSAIFEGEEE